MVMPLTPDQLRPSVARETDQDRDRHERQQDTTTHESTIPLGPAPGCVNAGCHPIAALAR
jgi:hypothetical protein